MDQAGGLPESSLRSEFSGGLRVEFKTDARVYRLITLFQRPCERFAGIAHWPGAKLRMKTLSHEKRQNAFIHVQIMAALQR